MLTECVRSFSSLRQTKRQLSIFVTVFNNKSSMAGNNAHADSFSLHDLRVEAVCPPNNPVYCGAKDGDYFILKGEMLYLPPEQGFSIYSLGSLSNLLFDTRVLTVP